MNWVIHLQERCLLLRRRDGVATQTKYSPTCALFLHLFTECEHKVVKSTCTVKTQSCCSWNQNVLPLWDMILNQLQLVLSKSAIWNSYPMHILVCMHQVCDFLLLCKSRKVSLGFFPCHKQLLFRYKLELIYVQQHQSIFNNLFNSKQTIISSIFDRVVPVTCQTALVQTYRHIFGRISEPFVCEPQSTADIRLFKPAVIA